MECRRCLGKIPVGEVANLVSRDFDIDAGNLPGRVLVIVCNDCLQPDEKGFGAERSWRGKKAVDLPLLGKVQWALLRQLVAGVPLWLTPAGRVQWRDEDGKIREAIGPARGLSSHGIMEWVKRDGSEFRFATVTETGHKVYAWMSKREAANVAAAS